MGRIRTIERGKLLDAAEDVTMEKGPAGLTIAAVAGQMGITNGGVQYSFRSKESLIAAMFERWQHDYAELMIELGAKAGDEPSWVRAHIAYAADYDGRSRRRGPSLLVSLLNSPQHMDQIRKWYRNRVDAIDVSTAGAVAAPCLRRDGGRVPDAVVRADRHGRCRMEVDRRRRRVAVRRQAAMRGGARAAGGLIPVRSNSPLAGGGIACYRTADGK
ncbi:TetR/AcrR family transcriptional regulator [Sphingomonas hankookensis]|uniref:TetR/AcrR family transcriptional regulator n=1 Tax=Sphingomonas hankookensis TaxID=563996 RepID=UPI003D3039FE